VDMSEYMEPHSVARLVGSPPGYIGHDEEGQLTGKLRTTPYSLVLLDEVEKAHPRVLDVFLQLFDEGRIADAKGRTVDARNAVFIMTSNIGGTPGVRRKPLGFQASDNAPPVDGAPVLDALRQHFRTEFINRIDEIIAFSPLSREAMVAIARKTFDGIAGSLRRKYGSELILADGVLHALCEKGFSVDFGARNLTRVIQEAIEMPLAELLAAGRPQPPSRIRCVLESGKIVLRAE